MTASIKKICSLSALLGFGVMATQGASAACSYSVSNEWNTGLTGTITITNSSTSAVSGWTVGWQYATNSLSSSWNANVSGNNPYTASNLNWNGSLQPGQSVSFGVQVNKNGGAAEVPTITGSICSGTVNSSVPASSSEPSSVAPSSVAPSSVPASSSSVSSASGGQVCNWYGTRYPLCVTTQSGWGWENSQSCIAASTCSAQPAPFGIEGGGSSVPASSSSVPGSSSSVPGSSSIPSSSSTPSSSSVPSSSSSSQSSVTPGERLDNPFVGARWYIDPVWSGKALAEPNGAKIAGYNTAVWMDRIGAIAPTDGTYGLRDHLDAALDQNANLIMVVVYDLPNRDCHALASNGELVQGPEGTQRYRHEYVDTIYNIFADPAYKDLRIIAIIEPDSLPNLVTNMDDPDCVLAADTTHGYIPNTQYTLNKLYPLSNVYSYVDIGHSGWLGWDNNFTQAITLIGNTIKGTTHGVNSVAGFVSNTAGYTPLVEPFLGPYTNSAMPGSGGGTQVRQAKFYEWNPHFGELSFVKAWRNSMIASGFPSSLGMLIDTGRNGWGGAARPLALSTSTDLNTFVDSSRIDRRSHRGNWCNQSGGVGERPQVINSEGVDAYVWVKPPGESDGAASLELSYDPQDPAKGFDRMCDPTYTRSEDSGTTGTGALPNAPVAGRWFSEAFQTLVNNAYPTLE